MKKETQKTILWISLFVLFLGCIYGYDRYVKWQSNEELYYRQYLDNCNMDGQEDAALLKWKTNSIASGNSIVDDLYYETKILQNQVERKKRDDDLKKRYGKE